MLSGADSTLAQPREYLTFRAPGVSLPGVQTGLILAPREGGVFYLLNPDPH